MKKNIFTPKHQPKPSKILNSPQNKLKSNNDKIMEVTTSTAASRSSMEPKLSLKKKQSLKTLKEQASTSKCHISPKKLKISLTENNPHQNYQSEGQISFRQYCLLQGKWIPMLTCTQRGRILNPLFNKSSKQIENRASLTFATKRQEHFCTTTPVAAGRFEEIGLGNLGQLLKKRISEEGIEEQVFLPTCVQGTQIENTKAFQIQILKSVDNPCNSPSDVQTEQKKEIKDLSPVKNFAAEKSLSENYVQQKQRHFEMEVMDAIYQRQYKQMGMILEFGKTSEQFSINTSVESVHQYFGFLQQALQDEEAMKQILIQLRTGWGLCQRQKLKRLRQGGSLSSNNSVLPEYLFQMIEEKAGTNCYYEFMHNRCLFDCINYELRKLKPFYDSNGECFPWDFKLTSSLTFYDISENNLSLILSEVGTKVYEYCSNLCGLHVQINEAGDKILQKRKDERENMMIKSEILSREGKVKDENQVQNQVTGLLISISNSIFDYLLNESLEE